MTNPAATARLAYRREWIAFTVLVLPLLLVSMDVSVLYFAIPAITRQLDPSATQQLWIFDSYAFALSGLLITMGSLGDRIGRRKLLLMGAAAFGLASVGAAYATSPEMLIAARVLLGIGGATLMPSTLALVRNLFQDDKQRGQAIAIWSGVMTGGIALGSVMSGLMLNHFWWGSVFLINVPAMLLLLLLVPVLVPEFKDPAPGRFDLLSVPLSMAAVLPLVYGLKEIAAEGFEPLYLGCVAVGLVFGYVFLRRQRTREDAMISRALFRGRGFGAADRPQHRRRLRHDGFGLLHHPVPPVGPGHGHPRSGPVEPRPLAGHRRRRPRRSGPRPEDRPGPRHRRMGSSSPRSDSP